MWHIALILNIFKIKLKKCSVPIKVIYQMINCAFPSKSIDICYVRITFICIKISMLKGRLIARHFSYKLKFTKILTNIWPKKNVPLLRNSVYLFKLLAYDLSTVEFNVIFLRWLKVRIQVWETSFVLHFNKHMQNWDG